MSRWRAVILTIMLIFCVPEPAKAKLADEFFKTRGLKLLHQNARGLLSNFHAIEKFMHSYKDIDILAVTETHINNKSEEGLFEIPNYQFVANNRKRGQGGGCPPNSSKHLSKNFNTEFNESLIAAQKEQREVIILGDFNANFLNPNNNKELKTTINFNGFQQMVSEPTRITQTTETLIDLILTNNPMNINEIIVTPLSIGDHDLIGCIRKLNCKRYTSRSVISRDYKNYDAGKLAEDPKLINWGLLYDCNNIELAANTFTKTLKDIFDKHAPFKSKIIKGKAAPWLKVDLRKLMNERDQALRKARKTKSQEDFQVFKELRNKCNGKLKEAKRKYHQNLINESQGNARKFWDAVKRVFPLK
eukprot:gene10377-11459_t